MSTKNKPTRKRSFRELFTLSNGSDHGEVSRLVNKNGESNLSHKSQPGSDQCFYPNIFLSVVKLHSRWISLVFLSCFLLSWFIFATLYYFVSETYGNFNKDADTTTKCVEGTDDFLSIFQFSMETQTTIGYGSRYVTENCPVSILLVILQSIIGSLMLSFLTGVVLFKFQEPCKRAHTVLFSKCACVFEEDGKYYVEIQILNMQKSQVIGPAVVGLCIMDKDCGRGKFRFDMDFLPFPQNSRLFFRPRIYRHLVDTDSPFWDFDRVDFRSKQYEIVIMLNGVDEFTDTFIQARTSYLPSEILWSRSFKTMRTSRTGKTFRLSYRDFTVTTASEMPDDSASVTSRKLSDVSSVIDLDTDSEENIEESFDGRLDIDNDSVVLGIQ